ncbi:MAG: alternative ribosome rescue aminoacyl-tRNA hydrolase ArfB [Polyangiaceae bacterium]
MADPILIRADVVVPPQAMEVHAVRSSGPGGQNVNKVASKVELRVDLTQVVGLDAGVLGRLRALAAGLLDAEGRLLVTSQRTRDQRANLEDAKDKIRALIAAALVRPRSRRNTKPSRASVERRIADKKRRARVKTIRREAEG